jgi:hypothetical protein
MTLIEVLVAIFIMAIGLLALLALFPLGALRMAQAMKDNRGTTSAQNAHSLAIAQDIRNDPLVISDIPNGGSFSNLFANPGPLTLAGTPVLPNADPYGESYPIFVDPIGFGVAPLGNAQDWVTGYSPAFGGYLRRRPVLFTSLAPGGPQLNIYRNFTLWDDIVFDRFNIPGTPELTPAPALLVKRDTRYSWAYMMRRPMTSDPSIVDCSVVIFDQRTLSLTNSLNLEEYLFPNAFFNPSLSTVTIDYSLANPPSPPPVRPGDWILDNTYYSPRPGVGSANANFHRVVAVENLGGTIIRYEVQNPIRGHWANKNPAGYVGTVTVIRGISEVFDKGTVRLP